MEQIQDEMRMNQGKKNAMRNMRAIERQRKMPQNLQDNELEHSEHRMKGSGGAAGLDRVIGAGRKVRGRGRSPSSDSCSSDEEMEGGAKHMGRMMFEHLKKVHGEGYARKFMSGGAAPRLYKPAGVEVEHARMSPAQVGLPGSGLGGQDVPPGGMAPMAYGTAPQAPPSFQRNSISLGSQGILPSAQVGSGKRKAAKMPPSVHHEMDMVVEGGKAGGKAARNVRGVYDGPEPAAPTTVVKGGARAARGAAISKLMREKKMSLPEASKYLKEHGMK